MLAGFRIKAYIRLNAHVKYCHTTMFAKKMQEQHHDFCQKKAETAHMLSKSYPSMVGTRKILSYHDICKKIAETAQMLSKSYPSIIGSCHMNWKLQVSLIK